LDHLLDLEQVAAQADWVVHHGNHATSAEFSFAGVPQLAIPLHQEHLFCALRLVEQSCGLAAYQDQASFVAAVQAMGERADLRVGARAVQASSVAYDSVGVDGFFRSLLQDI
jgi:UDP:flavonoid glycosyltransferase YjiC (YdhE family)